MQRIFSTLLTVFMIISAAVVITATSASAQTASEAWGLSQRDMSMGARMLGMSARGYAGQGDYSALYSNPAGLGYVESSRIIASVRGSASRSDPEFNTGGFTLLSAESAIESSGPGNLAFLYNAPVERGKLVVGLGVGQVRNFSRELDFSGRNSKSTITESFLPYDREYSIDKNGDLEELDDLPFAAFNGGFIEYFRELHEDGKYPFWGAVEPGTLIQQSGLAAESGQVYELSGGAAWLATPNLMAGASVNVVFGDYQFDYIFTETDINNENGTDEYSVLLDDGSLLEGFDELEYRQRLDKDLVGVNFRVGISATPHHRIQVGLTLESPTWMFIEESYGSSFLTRFDRGGEISYGDDPTDVGNGTYEYSMRTPWRLGGGVNLRLGRVLLTGEGEIMDWAQLRLSSDDGKNVFRDVNSAIEDEFGIGLNAAFGIEVNAWGVDLRTGYAYRSSPYKKPGSARELRYGDRDAVSFGIGTRITDGIRIDFGAQLETERDIWDTYPSDDQGARQETVFEIDEVLERGIILLELTVNL